MWISVHAVSAGRVDIFDEAQVERSSAILVALEFGDRRLGGFGIVEPHDTATTGTSAGLVLYLGLFDLANSRKELNKILVARRPRKL